MKKKLYVFLDETYIGEVSIDEVRGRETYMFRYSKDYLRPDRPLLDPDIQNVLGPQFSHNGTAFGFLCDISPDRWGRRLIQRREKRPLMESDYIAGVCDLTRQGAIRIKADTEGEFVAGGLEDAAPPWTTIRKLEEAARHFDADDRSDEERWLKDLLCPGSSLGGARPKANVMAPDGSLWIAKFPSESDEWDVGALEYKTSLMAKKAGLNVPETKAGKFSKSGTTFFSKRFDRLCEKRIHYASAMTMLGACDGEEGHSYLEIAEFISENSADPKADLRELWSRMAFSELVSNLDDHLRNHGFLLTPKGWRLSPLFDVNPSPKGGNSALDRGDIMKDASYYRLTKAEAESRYAEIKAAVGPGRLFRF